MNGPLPTGIAAAWYATVDRHTAQVSCCRISKRGLVLPSLGGLDVSWMSTSSVYRRAASPVGLYVEQPTMQKGLGTRPKMKDIPLNQDPLAFLGVHLESLGLHLAVGAIF